MSTVPSRSSAAATHRRRNDDSWIELSPQQSSPSVSSVSDEIVTTGLRVGPPQPSSPPRRRRSRQPLSCAAVDRRRPASAAAANPATVAETSSQEEYDETESEEDRVLTASSSSTENLALPPPAPVASNKHASDADSDSDFDKATALGAPAASRPIFRPQPNAFSHPPSHPSLQHRSHSTNTTLPQHLHASFSRRASAGSYRRRGSGGNYMSPEYRADNDAALRASLTTLLSYGVAARGLPKSAEEMDSQGPRRGGVGPSSDPVELMLIPESELAAEEEAAAALEAAQPLARLVNPSSGSSSPISRGKRTGTAPGRGGSTRATKKKRTSPAGVGSVPDDALLSPTVLTWVISAGVVVIFSVVGFGAGYVIGREVGRQEVISASASAAAAGGATSCGREVIVMSGGGGGGGLRRLRWGGGIMKGGVVA